MSLLNRKRRKAPKPAHSQLRAIAETTELGVTYNELVSALQRARDPQKLLDTPQIFTYHIKSRGDSNLIARTLFDLIRLGFVYTHEYATLRLYAYYYKRLNLILRPWRIANHHSRPPRVRQAAHTMFTLRCVEDSIVGALPPEVLYIIMYFVL